jgi:hypothetical protein
MRYQQINTVIPSGARNLLFAAQAIKRARNLKNDRVAISEV